MFNQHEGGSFRQPQTPNGVKTAEVQEFGKLFGDQLLAEMNDIEVVMEREKAMEQLCAARVDKFSSLIPDLKLAPTIQLLHIVQEENRQYKTLLEHCIELLQPKEGESSDADIISAVSLYLDNRSKYYHHTHQKLNNPDQGGAAAAAAAEGDHTSLTDSKTITPRTGRPQPPPAGPPRGMPPQRGAPGGAPPSGRGTAPPASAPGPGAARAGVPMPRGGGSMGPTRGGGPPPAGPGRGTGLMINPDLGKLLAPGGPAPRNPTVNTLRQQDVAKKRLSGASVQGSSSPQNLLRDLIISERDYVKSWSYVMNLLDRVRKERIPERDEEIIFFKVEAINSLHRELLVALEEALNNWPNKLIGALFLRRCLAFKVYVAYVTNRTLQKDQLENLKASSRTFANVLKNWERDTEKDLLELLDMPEKRIVAYEQFLMKMVIGTDERDPDYQYLSQAQKEYLQIKSEAAKSFKTGLRIEEQIKFRKQLQLASEEFIIDPKRRLIREGPLKSLNEKGKDKDMDYFFLYSDMLLCTKRTGSIQYRFIRKIPLKNASLEKKVPMPKGGFYPNTFRIHMDKTTLFVFAADQKEEFHEWIVAVKKALNEARATQVFGVSLKIMTDNEKKRTGNNVPWIAEEAATFIMDHCVLKEGIFRLAGSASEIDKLKDMIQQGERFSFEEISHSVDENVLADIFKFWIRELPGPLLTYGLYNAWIQAASQDSPDKCVAAYKGLVDKLPVDNRYLLQVLVKCLKSVVDHSDVNKMTVGNLSIIFAPNIMKRRNAPLVDPDSRVIVKICGDLIENYDVLFQDVEKVRLQEKEASQKIVQDNQDAERMRVEYLATVPLDRKEKLVPHSTVAIPEGEIIKLGQLLKKGAHAKSSFKARWFVLKYKQLAYFKSRSEMNKAPQGVIELKDCCVDLMEGEHKEGVKFCVLKESRCYEIAASTEKERDEWMSAINSCIENRVVRTVSEIMEREEKAAGGFFLFKGL